MNHSKTISIVSTVFILFCAFCLLSVSVMAFTNPQSVMDLVGVKLNNTDAFSSIRGVYGGAGMAMVIFLITLIRTNRQLALFFLLLLWGLYALSRLITQLVEGPLGDFGNTWIVIESVLFAVSLVLWLLTKRLINA